MCRGNVQGLDASTALEDDEMASSVKKTFPREYTVRTNDVKKELSRRGGKLRKRFVVGNTHETVRDTSSFRGGPVREKNRHRWTMFVRVDGEDGERTSDYIDKVIFSLHPTFRPNKLVVAKEPFQVSRWGWGTFEVGVQIIWANGKKTVRQLDHELSFASSGVLQMFVEEFEPGDVPSSSCLSNHNGQSSGGGLHMTNAGPGSGDAGSHGSSSSRRQVVPSPTGLGTVPPAQSGA